MGTIQSKLVGKVMPESTLFELAKYPELAMEVGNGNIAGLVVDSPVADALVEANDKLAISKYTFNKEEANFGKACVVKKGNDELTTLANKVIDKAMEEGTYTKAYEEAIALSKTLGI